MTTRHHVDTNPAPSPEHEDAYCAKCEATTWHRPIDDNGFRVLVCDHGEKPQRHLRRVK
jgi:hypothetical protein